MYHLLCVYTNNPLPEMMKYPGKLCECNCKHLLDNNAQMFLPQYSKDSNRTLLLQIMRHIQPNFALKWEVDDVTLYNMLRWNLDFIFFCWVASVSTFDY